jgi:hypothetical protein
VREMTIGLPSYLADQRVSAGQAAVTR